MILFSRTDNQVDNVREAAAAPSALLHGVIDLRRYDQLPTVLVQEAIDDVPDFPVGDVIATAN
jgi:hypothetical protein